MDQRPAGPYLYAAAFFDFLKKSAFSGSRTIRSVGIDRFEFTVFRSDAIMYYHFRGLRVYEKNAG